MARGFDSKSVSDQQEENERARDPQGRAAPTSARRRGFELARVDLVRRLEAAPEGHKKQLKAALAALDEMIRKA